MVTNDWRKSANLVNVYHADKYPISANGADAEHREGTKPSSAGRLGKAFDDDQMLFLFSR
jgi:hypothetical protein